MSYIEEAYQKVLTVKQDIPMRLYNAERSLYLSSSHLKLIASESLADYKADIDNVEPKPDTVPFIEGRAMHCLILEGDEEFNRCYQVGGPRHTKGKYIGQEFGTGSAEFLKTARECRIQTGRDLVTSETFNKSLAMRESCHKHPIIADILKEGIPEVTLRFEINGVKCQIRVDWFSPRYGIVEFKSCERIQSFKKDALWNYGYHTSAGFYRTGVHALTGVNLPYVFICCEKEGINKAGVFMVEDDVLCENEIKNELIIKDLAEARQTGKYKTNYEELQFITN